VEWQHGAEAGTGGVSLHLGAKAGVNIRKQTGLETSSNSTGGTKSTSKGCATTRAILVYREEGYEKRKDVRGHSTDRKKVCEGAHAAERRRSLFFRVDFIKLNLLEKGREKPRKEKFNSLLEGEGTPSTGKK